MQDVNIPQHVFYVLFALEKAGHKAYLVGGCVRDSLLGRRCKDWDVCTGARPEEVLSIFPAALPTGIKYGTVTVLVDKNMVEVTTFRSEGGYSDNRLPDSVEFVTDLNTDLARRDFTMNAIAVTHSGRFFDPFSGCKDIKNRLIRCVGGPAVRFKEDALRMFRALRFSAELDFNIEQSVSDALQSYSHLCAAIAPERVSAELEKLLVSPSPGKLRELLAFGLMDSYVGIPRATVDFSRMAMVPWERKLRWAAFCCVLAQAGLIFDTESFLLSLRLDAGTVKYCSAGISFFLGGLPDTKTGWKHRLSACGEDAAYCAAAVADALCPGRSPGQRVSELRAVLKSGECWSLKQLAVTGGDLLSRGYKGPEIGEALENLLDYVIERPEKNKKECLLGLLNRTDK